MKIHPVIKAHANQASIQVHSMAECIEAQTKFTSVKNEEDHLTKDGSVDTRQHGLVIHEICKIVAIIS